MRSRSPSDGRGWESVNALLRAKQGRAAQEPLFGTDVSYLEVKPAVTTKGLILEKYNDRDYGYLRIDVTKDQIGISYHVVGQGSIAQSRIDKVTVDLKTHEMIAN